MDYLSLFLIFLSVKADDFPDYCLVKCENQLRHVMCNHKTTDPGKHCNDALDTKVPANMNREILKLQNYIRSYVATGKVRIQPHAGNMHRLQWDRELAMIAQRSANQCMVYSRSCNNAIDDEPVGHISDALPEPENKSLTFPVALKAIVNLFWYAQSVHFKWPKDGIYIAKGKKSRKRIAEDKYTQLVWGMTLRVGCGYASFRKEGEKSRSFLLVCNYRPTGNVNGSEIYKNDRPCTACPDNECSPRTGLCGPYITDSSTTTWPTVNLLSFVVSLCLHVK